MFRYGPGQISAETQYVLNHFQVDAPPFLDNIGTRVRGYGDPAGAGCAQQYFPEKRMEPHDYAECIYTADHK